MLKVWLVTRPPAALRCPAMMPDGQRPASHPEPIDPIRFEVVRNALTSATEEMAATIRRAAYSTNIKTRADFSCCFLDRELRVVAQSFAQPIHLGNLSNLVPNAVRQYGAERLVDGDMVIVNDPYLANIHLNDITVFAPVVIDGTLVGYLANLAHHVDVGGGAPASIAATREIFQEGVRIPPVRLVAGGVVVDDVFRLILAQIRSTRETTGDLRAQIAANITGRRRVAELVEALGSDEVDRYTAALIDYTRRRTQHEVARLPRGEFVAETSLDSDGFGGPPVRLRVSIRVDDDGVLFDFTGSDPQRSAPVNSTYGPTYSACAYALKALIDPDIPVNSGFYESVRVIAPEGTVVHALPPAPAVGAGEVNMRLCDLIFRAFAEALPERVPAAGKGIMCHAGFGGIDPRSGEYYCVLETLAGGYGGRAALDGPDAVQAHTQNTENAPIEETEAGYPIRIARYELVPDSEGAGRTRGGLGLRRDYEFPDHGVSFSVLADRDLTGAWGVFGGEPGRRARYVVNPGPDETVLDSKVTVQLRPGDLVSYETPGGGGYGPPAERDPELVLRDVRDGKVSLERARSVYGVAIDAAAWQVDVAATASLRGAGSRGEDSAT
jgi:N-methylhydantoinase B